MNENQNNVTFKPAKTQRASDVIYQQIYQKIVNGELKNGDRLPPERDLCEQFGRSRPSIREALRMLQQDGLINITVGTNGGAVVKGVSLDGAEQSLKKLIDLGAISLKELTDYRVYNDGCCYNLAAQYRTEKDIVVLQDIMQRYKEAIGDSPTLSKVDIEFHKAVAQATHNKLCILITDVITTLCTDLFWNVAAQSMTEDEVVIVNQKAYDNHNAVVDAIIAGDTEKMLELTNASSALFFESIESVV